MPPGDIRSRRRARTVVVLLSMIAIVAVSCAPDTDRKDAEPAARADGPLRVAVVNHPLEYFAQRIGGDLVEVVFPAPSDLDPAFWSPDADAVAAYQQADVILRNGAGYAGWIDRATLPASRIVDTSGAFTDRLLEIEDAVSHSHGPTGEHSHGATAFTTWLDPRLAIEHARAVHDALVTARPEHEAAFAAAYDSLERDLQDLDRRLEAAFANFGDAPVLGSHPVYQYLAARYALNLRSVHFEPDEFPDERAWRDLEEMLADHPARAMLWEGEPLAETAARLEALGVAVVLFDPCGNRPEDGDWLTTMTRNVDALVANRG
jgi:zinc transport system substrate-binding protein